MEFNSCERPNLSWATSRYDHGVNCRIGFEIHNARLNHKPAHNNALLLCVFVLCPKAARKRQCQYTTIKFLILHILANSVCYPTSISICFGGLKFLSW